MTTYNTAQLTSIGLGMEDATGHLVPHAVARAWAAAEQGIHNNPYGVTSGGRLMSFPTLEGGIETAAKLLITGPAYSSTIAALKTAKQASTIAGRIRGAALAIATSPWHLGAAGLAAHGGVDPYYLSVFNHYGLLAGGAPAPVPAPVPVPEPVPSSTSDAIPTADDVDLVFPGTPPVPVSSLGIGSPGSPAPLETPSRDTVGLLYQYLFAEHHPDELPADAWAGFANADQVANQIVQLTAAILASGSAYYAGYHLSSSDIHLARELETAHRVYPLYASSLTSGEPLYARSIGVESQPPAAA